MGKALLQGQWDEAIALVMSTRFVSHGAEAAAKQGFSEHWHKASSLPLHQRRPRMRELVSAALRAMPEHCFGEISMLRALAADCTSRYTWLVDLGVGSCYRRCCSPCCAPLPPPTTSRQALSAMPHGAASVRADACGNMRMGT